MWCCLRFCWYLRVFISSKSWCVIQYSVPITLCWVYEHLAFLVGFEYIIHSGLGGGLNMNFVYMIKNLYYCSLYCVVMLMKSCFLIIMKLKHISRSTPPPGPVSLSHTNRNLKSKHVHVQSILIGTEVSEMVRN